MRHKNLLQSGFDKKMFDSAIDRERAISHKMWKSWWKSSEENYLAMDFIILEETLELNLVDFS